MSQEVTEKEGSEKLADDSKDESTKDAISPLQASKQAVDTEESNETKDAISPSEAAKETMETEEEKEQISSNDISKDVVETKQQRKSPRTNRKKIQQAADVIIKEPLTDQGIKRKLVDYDDSESDHSSQKTDETSPSSEEASVNNEIPNNSTELPLALRRPRRSRRSFLSDQSNDSSSTNKTASDVRLKSHSIIPFQVYFCRVLERRKVLIEIGKVRVKHLEVEVVVVVVIANLTKVVLRQHPMNVIHLKMIIPMNQFPKVPNSTNFSQVISLVKSMKMTIAFLVVKHERLLNVKNNSSVNPNHVFDVHKPIDLNRYCYVKTAMMHII